MNNQTHRILSIKIKISYKRINFKSIKIRNSFLQYKKIANSIQTIMQNYNIHCIHHTKIHRWQSQTIKILNIY
jgi:hypothetical protein